MKLYFESVKTKLLEALGEEGYALKSENYGDKAITAVLENTSTSLKLEYLYANKLFVLSKGDPGCADEDYVKSQSYLFDKEAGDGLRETISVTAEFLDTMRTKPVNTNYSSVSKKKKDKDSDESSAVFFVNRIPSVMPECREPMLLHKAHYGQLLPRWFCEEVVAVAMSDMLKKGEKSKCAAFFKLLDGMYMQGDLDTKSIIMQVLMPVVTDERDKEYIKSIVSADFRKAWDAGKRWFGKNVRPEKENMYTKMAQYQAETLVTDRSRR